MNILGGFMFRMIFSLGILGMLTIAAAFAASVNYSTPIGQWFQIDDVTGKPHSIIKIYQEHDRLYGKIVKGIPRKGEILKERCELCPGALHNKLMIGLVILTDFVQVGDGIWGNGKILDPDNGKIYQCKLTLDDQGRKLRVRGFVGISLLGRTQVWQRVESK